MNDRDCESCKHFSRIDPIESEGHCDKKRDWVDPYEGRECKMHEFTLSSATKYKDGTPMMSEPKSNQLDIHFCEEDCCPHWNSCPHTLWDKQNCPYLPHDTDSHLKYLEQIFKEFAQVQDDIVEEYEARISELEEEVENLRNFCSRVDQFLNHFTNHNRLCPEFSSYPHHTGDNFCGNCSHCDHGKQGDDTVYVCSLSAEIVDPDASSCSMFEHPF